MKLFSTKYVNKAAVKGNIVLLFLYIIASPLSKLFVKLKISPNIVTLGSIIAAILAFASLIADNGYIYFCLFWVISLHLDFCDGTVARMTGKVNKTSFRFDHMSDLFKISLILLGAGIHYNTFTIWVLSTAAIFSFLYTDILNHNLDLHSYFKQDTNEFKPLQNDVHNIRKESLRSRAKNSPVIVNLLTIFAGINGHTLLLFLLLPFGIIYTKLFLIYFTLLSIIRSIKVINKLLNLPKLKKVNQNSEK